MWKTTVETGGIRIEQPKYIQYGRISIERQTNECEEEDSIRNILLIIFLFRCISEVNKNKVMNGCLLGLQFTIYKKYGVGVQLLFVIFSPPIQ